MNGDSSYSSSERVSVGHIAELAGVRPSAVSNWRSRHSDFPLPVEEAPSGDLFDLEAILAWLDSKNKPYSRPVQEWDRLLWSSLDLLRDEGARIEESALVVMQLLYLRFRFDHPDGPAGDLEGALWRSLESHPARILETWSEFIRRIDAVSPNRARALSPPSGMGDKAIASAVHLLGRIHGEHVDWGTTATLFLYRYQEAMGMRGEASTPQSVTVLQVALLQPISGTVYDPASGAAMVLAEAWRHRNSEDVRLVGQEVSEYNWRFGFLHLALNGATFDLDTGDTLRDDRFRSLRADRVAADPPFGQKPQIQDAFGDPRWSFGVPRGTADWLWAQQVVHHLAEGGVGVMTIAPGALSRSGGEESIRRSIVEADLLDAVIELPPGLFAGTSIPAALMVFAKDRVNRRGRVLFLDAKQLGQPRRGRPHELEEADIARVLATVEAWRRGEFNEEARFASAATTDDIWSNKIDLSPKRYVRYATRVTEIEGEPIPERLNRLSRRLEELLPEAGAVAAGIFDEVETFAEASGPDWPLVRLGDLLVAEARTGTRQDSEGDGTPIPYIQTGLVSGGNGHLATVPDEVTRGNVRGRTVTRGDVLLASRGISAENRVGCAIVEIDAEAAYSESLIRLSPDPERLNPGYLQLFLTSRQGRTALAAATTGSVIANLRGEALQEVEVRLPDIVTQQEIVRAMHGLNAGITEVERFLTTCRAAFDTLREGIAAGLYAPHSGRTNQNS